MYLAIKHIHNLPPHLSYASTLPDITQKPKRDIDELKHRLIDNYIYIYSSLFTITVVEYNIKNTLTNKLN